MNEIFQIAIDGPGGAGKSTIAKKLANKLNIEYIDTGAMYRAVALKLLEMDLIDCNDETLNEVLNNTNIELVLGKTFLDGKDVSSDIRTSKVSVAASTCSARALIREKLVDLQRKMGMEKSVVMDGRDIGTNVFKNAKYKFYLNAEPTVRAKRRYEEMLAKGMDVDFDQVLADITTRDNNDMSRALNPLKKAADAKEIDSSNMTIDEVVLYMCKEIEHGSF